jgi:hypothetical protein
VQPTKSSSSGQLFSTRDTTPRKVFTDHPAIETTGFSFSAIRNRVRKDVEEKPNHT